MKTVGIIGGLGPQTTASFYLRLIFSCQKMPVTNRPPILMYSVPLPYDVEQEAIRDGKGEERCLPLLIEAARRLEGGGADFIVMPCNSLHSFIEDIRAAVSIPVLSIVETATKFLHARGVREVGIISTSITLQKGLYEKNLASYGIHQVKPTAVQQRAIGTVIHNLVCNKKSDADKKMLLSVVDSFRSRGVGHVILACTDLQLIAPKRSALEIYDTMRIFADETVLEMFRN